MNSTKGSVFQFKRLIIFSLSTIFVFLFNHPIMADPTVEPGYTVEIFATGFNASNDLEIDFSGNLLVSETNESRVIKIEILADGTAGALSVFASGIFDVEGLALDSDGNLFVSNLDSVYKVSGGTAAPFVSPFNDAEGLAIDQSGNLFIADDDVADDGTRIGVRISKVEILSDGSAGNRSTFANIPSGSPTPAADIEFDSNDDLFVSDNEDEVWKVEILSDGSAGVPSPFAYIGEPTFALDYDSSGNLFVGTSFGSIWRIDPEGTADLFGIGFHSVEGLKFDTRGNLFVSDQNGSESIIFKINKIRQVAIDIKPGSDPNCFNINGHGVIPVAILGNSDFDVIHVDLSTLSFGGLKVRVRGNKGPLCSTELSNEDAFLDLVCHFEDDPENWEPGNDTATLIGKLNDGTPIEGTDSICIVP